MNDQKVHAAEKTEEKTIIDPIDADIAAIHRLKNVKMIEILDPEREDHEAEVTPGSILHVQIRIPRNPTISAERVAVPPVLHQAHLHLVLLLLLLKELQKDVAHEEQQIVEANQDRIEDAERILARQKRD